MQTLLILLLAAAAAVAQTNIYGDRNVKGNLTVDGATLLSRGTSLPGTCTVGQYYFKTDAVAGQNLYGCTATNTWTLQSGAAAAHASTHQNGGGDEVATATPGANAIPKAGGGGTLNAGWIPTLNQSTSGNAATATALAANGANCGGGQAAAGVDASGAAEGCFTPGGGVGITRTTVAFSATPTFTRSSAIQQWIITLTGNVTSSTTSGLTASDVVTFEICQDGTGSHTFSWPTGFTKAGIIDGTANTCSHQMFVWDGSAAQPLGAMYVSGVTGGAIELPGATSGSVKLVPPAVAGTTTLTFPGATGTLARTADNVATATALAANPAACSAGQYVSDIAADGTLTCGTPSGGSSFDPLDMNTTYVRDTFTHTKAIAADHWNSDSGSWEFGGTCTIANTVSSVGHDGVLSVTATTNATICSMRTNPTTMQITSGTANVGTEVRFHFRLLNTTNVTFGIGMWDSFSQTYGFGVRFIAGTDTNFMFLRNNSGATTADSGVTPNTSNWYVFRARVTSNGTWSFDISTNGGAWSTAKTACSASCDLAAITTEAVKPHMQLTPAEAASKVAYIDDFGAKIVRGSIHP